MYVQIMVGLVKVAESPPFGKMLLTCLIVFSICIVPICSYSYFSFVLRVEFWF